MQRVLVMGCSGSGKSTFARKLADRCGLPFVSIDQLFWQPGWREPDRNAFIATMTREAEKPAWVIDGNYTSRSAAELRRARADTIFWFDLPRWVCMVGVLRRSLLGYGVVRPEMAPGCPEQFDLTFYRYVWSYRELQRPKLLAYFAELRGDQTLVTFTTRAQAGAFLARAA
ncbi:MAG: DNA topology modulation protein [Alphaproteobacteria bacterium]|nr:DNA topology modulation protein [Alphaproteobacteria bacterium]